MRPERAIPAVALALLLAPVAAAKPPVKLEHASLTFYWIIYESSARYRGAPDAALCDARGDVIERTSTKFRRALVLEGSGCLRDGRTVSYYRKVHGEHRFRVAKANSGITATGCAPVPFRTVAVDPRFIPLGSTIYIPQLKGLRLPDGTIHDGFFVAADRGRFHGRRIDIFVGAGPRGALPFVRSGHPSRSKVTVVVMN